jgi:hypothetical protein
MSTVAAGRNARMSFFSSWGARSRGAALFLCCVMCLLAGVTGAAWGQQVGAAGPGDTGDEAVAVELVRTGGMDGELDEFAGVVRDTLVVVLQRRGFEVVPGGGIDADLRYEYSLLGFLPRLHVGLTVCDAAAGTRIAGAMAAARGNITLYSSVDELVASLEPAVSRHMRVRADPDGGLWPVEVTEGIVLPAVDSGGRTLHFTEVVSGTTLSPGYTVARGVALPVRVSADGVYSEEIVFPVTNLRPRLPDVTLRPLRRFGVQLQYGFPRMIGAGVGGRYYAVPDRLYGAVELGLSMSGFYEVTPQRMVHVDPRLVVGYVPFGARGFLVQPVVSSGVGLITTFVSYSDDPAPRYVDWYWNIVNVAAEGGRGRVRLYIRAGVSYFFRTEQGLWQTGLNPDAVAPELAAGTVLRW